MLKWLLSEEKPLTTQRPRQQRVLVNFGLLAVLVLVTGTIAVLYVSREKYFYHTDLSNYQNQTSELVSAFRVSILRGTKLVQSSFATDYNKLPCLPLVPFVFIFGDSRLVYILSCALLYIVPFALVAGAIATTIIHVCPHAVFWSTAFLTLLIPPTWTPTLRGYPDIGGAVIIGLAILVYLKDVRLKHWWQTPLIGFLLALATLFRRHFAYSARAFLVAIILQGLLIFFNEVRENPRKALSYLTRYGILTGLIAISSLATLTIIAPEFIKKIITINYRALYASYERAIVFVFQRYGKAYGWLTWLLTLLGFSAGIVTRVLVRPTISFIVIFGSLSLIQWGLFSRQSGNHYTTHFTIFVVLGVTALLWTSWLILKGKARILMLSVGILLLGINILMGLTFIGNFKNSLRPFFAANYPPLVRKDYDLFVQFLDRLRNMTSNEDAIYVASSSRILKHDLVKEAEKQLYGKENTQLNILRFSAIDSRDFYPIEELLKAQYVMVANPFQHSLPPEEQDVVKVVVDAFNEDWELAQDFERLPEQFFLHKNVIVDIYRRTRLTSPETALQTLKIMQERIQPKPGNSYEWMSYGTQPKNKLYFGKDKTVNLQTTFGTEPVSFLYFGSLPEWTTVSGTVQSSNCLGFKGFSLRLVTLNQEGNIINTKELIYSSKDSTDFSLSLPAKNVAYLRLDLVGHNKSDKIASCSVYIKNLAISGSEER